MQFHVFQEPLQTYLGVVYLLSGRVYGTYALQFALNVSQKCSFSSQNIIVVLYWKYSSLFPYFALALHYFVFNV